MNSRESERSSSFAPTDRQGPKWPLHPQATGSGAPRSVPKCRQKRNVPNCRLEGAEQDGIGSGFAELELVAGIELGGTAGLERMQTRVAPFTTTVPLVDDKSSTCQIF